MENITEGVKYKSYSEEVYQELLNYIKKQMNIDVADEEIVDSYRHAIAEDRYSLEYTGYHYFPIMDKIEDYTLKWAKLRTEGDFLVFPTDCEWMVKDQVGSFTYVTNRLFVDLCEANHIKEYSDEPSGSGCLE